MLLYKFHKLIYYFQNQNGKVWKLLLLFILLLLSLQAVSLTTHGLLKWVREAEAVPERYDASETQGSLLVLKTEEDHKPRMLYSSDFHHCREENTYMNHLEGGNWLILIQVSIHSELSRYGAHPNVSVWWRKLLVSWQPGGKGRVLVRF